MMMTKIPIILLCSLILSSGSLLAEDRVELQGTSIVGNRELPKVLYIVPWKGSELPQLGELPMGNLIDEALSPLDRDEFRRQIDFFNTASGQQ
jgi:hypothetical protein